MRESTFVDFLKSHPEVIGEGLKVIETEKFIGNGRIDILVNDGTDDIPVEVKMSPFQFWDGYEQLKRYMATIHAKKGILIVVNQDPDAFILITSNRVDEGIKFVNIIIKNLKWDIDIDFERQETGKREEFDKRKFSFIEKFDSEKMTEKLVSEALNEQSLVLIDIFFTKPNVDVESFRLLSEKLSEINAKEGYKIYRICGVVTRNDMNFSFIYDHAYKTGNFLICFKVFNYKFDFNDTDKKEIRDLITSWFERINPLYQIPYFFIDRLKGLESRDDFINMISDYKKSTEKPDNISFDGWMQKIEEKAKYQSEAVTEYQKEMVRRKFEREKRMRRR